MRTVGEVMSRDVLTVKSSETLGSVARAMRGRNVGSAVVVDRDDDRVVGLISERELVESVARSRNPDVGTAESWMRTDVVLISPGASIPDAVEAMRSGGVRHLPVGTDGRLAGVVSMRDLLADAIG